MNQTITHGLPMLAAAQAQKEVTHNEALLMIDRRLHITIESRRLVAPPATPAVGARFIVPGDATGSWAGQRDRIAGFDGFGWTFDVPRPGWLAWVADEQRLCVYDVFWRAIIAPMQSLPMGGRGGTEGAPTTVVAPVDGAVIDVESRRAINQLLAVMQAHGLIQ